MANDRATPHSTDQTDWRSMLIPQPLSATPMPGRFCLDGTRGIRASGEALAAAGLLAGYLQTATGAIAGHGAAGDIVLEVTADESAPPEGYELTVSEDAVHLTAPTAAGLLWGIQTLRQLLPAEALRPAAQARAWKVNCVRVQDAPAMRWRGAMLDVARHFIAVPDLLRFIDLMALHRLNVLHLHLTDDQGWRMQIVRYPRLTSVGAHRVASADSSPDIPPGKAAGPAHGGFYTQDDLRLVVDYAGARGVTVVPEIDVPGHVQSALAAYPELGYDPKPEVWRRWGVNPNVLRPNDASVEFFEQVLAEVMDVFPGPYVHIGGDECPTAQWATDPDAVSKARDLGLDSVDGLHGWFMSRLADFVSASGRRAVGWEQLRAGTAGVGSVVMTWHGIGDAVDAAHDGHDVVVAPWQQTYFDLHTARSASHAGRRVSPHWHRRTSSTHASVASAPISHPGFLARSASSGRSTLPTPGTWTT